MSEFHFKHLSGTEEKDLNLWKGFLKRSLGATLFHSPGFLAYHHQKFNEHHLAVYKGDALIGFLPMAFSMISEGGSSYAIAKSPYGGSYGGFIFSTRPDYNDSRKIVNGFIEYLKKLQVKRMVITPGLPIYNNVHSDTFTFALLEQGFKLVNSDIESVVLLRGKENIEMNVFSSRARNMARKAEKLGVECRLKISNVDDFWKVLQMTYQKHNTKPTHSYEELKWLGENLSAEVWFDAAYLNNEPIAGIAHFKLNDYTDSSFYLCSSTEFDDTQALSYLIYSSVLNSAMAGFHYFNFGTSSVNMVARPNLFKFKESFGAAGIFRNTYAIDL